MKSDEHYAEYQRGYAAGKSGKSFAQATSGQKGKKEAQAAFLKGFVDGQVARARGER